MKFLIKNDDDEKIHDLQYSWYRVKTKDSVEDDYYLDEWAGLGESDEHLIALYGIGDDVNVKQTIKASLPNFGDLVANEDNVGNDISEHGIFFSIPMDEDKGTLSIDGVSI